MPLLSKPPPSISYFERQQVVKGPPIPVAKRLESCPTVKSYHPVSQQLLPWQAVLLVQLTCADLVADKAACNRNNSTCKQSRIMQSASITPKHAFGIWHKAAWLQLQAMHSMRLRLVHSTSIGTSDKQARRVCACMYSSWGPIGGFVHGVWYIPRPGSAT